MGVPHLPAKEDKRTVKSFTCEHRPKRKVHIQQNPSEVSEGSFELAIEAIWSRPQARFTKAWRRCRNTIKQLHAHFLKISLESFL